MSFSRTQVRANKVFFEVFTSNFKSLWTKLCKLPVYIYIREIRNSIYKWKNNFPFKYLVQQFLFYSFLV